MSVSLLRAWFPQFLAGLAADVPAIARPVPAAAAQSKPGRRRQTSIYTEFRNLPTNRLAHEHLRRRGSRM
jgi:hypothetical protein